MNGEAPDVQGLQIGTGNTQHNYFYDSSAPPPSGTLQRVVFGSVPQAPPAFQHRGGLLEQLRSAGPGVAVVRSVTGMRGVGKTQLAAAYARECINNGWRLVAWVNAENTAETLGQLAAIADQLGVGQPGTPLEELCKLMRGRLEVDGENSLVVFDNVVDLLPLRPYLPAAGEARIVLTSLGLSPGIVTG
jgi:hypothetical protein